MVNSDHRNKAAKCEDQRINKCSKINETIKSKSFVANMHEKDLISQTRQYETPQKKRKRNKVHFHSHISVLRI